MLILAIALLAASGGHGDYIFFHFASNSEAKEAFEQYYQVDDDKLYSMRDFEDGSREAYMYSRELSNKENKEFKRALKKVKKAKFEETDGVSHDHAIESDSTAHIDFDLDPTKVNYNLYHDHAENNKVFQDMVDLIKEFSTEQEDPLKSEVIPGIDHVIIGELRNKEESIYNRELAFNVKKFLLQYAGSAKEKVLEDEDDYLYFAVEYPNMFQSEDRIEKIILTGKRVYIRYENGKFLQLKGDGEDFPRIDKIKVS